MEIKRILNLSDSEFDVLIDAGELLGKLRDAKETYDELSDGAKQIINGLKNVIEELK